MVYHRLVPSFPSPVLKPGNLTGFLINLFCCYGDSSSLSISNRRLRHTCLQIIAERQYSIKKLD